MAGELARQRCEACNAQTPRLSAAELEAARGELDGAWQVLDGRLRREWKTRDFAGAFARATAIALLAEGEGHHPDLEIGWGRLVVTLTTHALGGLSRNDVIMAAKIDRLGPDALP